MSPRLRGSHHWCSQRVFSIQGFNKHRANITVEKHLRQSNYEGPLLGWTFFFQRKSFFLTQVCLSLDANNRAARLMSRCCWIAANTHHTLLVVNQGWLCLREWFSFIFDTNDCSPSDVERGHDSPEMGNNPPSSVIPWKIKRKKVHIIAVCLEIDRGWTATDSTSCCEHAKHTHTHSGHFQEMKTPF